MKAKQTERTDRRGVALVMGEFESLGFAFREQAESDYGVDGHAELIKSEQPTGQLLGVQIKTGESYLSERTENEIVFRTDAEHVDYWLNHALPMIVCLCDADNQTIYWQAVTDETAISTGKGYRVGVPLTQILNVAAVPQLTDLLTPLVSPDRYTIFKTEDVSHGLAKRYSFKVVVNGTASKAEIASIVRQVTTYGAKRRYHRNHMVEERWGDTDAHVVWAFVYISAEDEARCNHFCRSLWICDSLDDEARPLPMIGENIGNDIIVDWSGNYSFLAQHTSTNSLTKEDYLYAVIPLIDELKRLLDRIGGQLLYLKNGDITEDSFLTATDADREHTNDIYMAISAMSVAPFECKDMDDRLECFIACMDNIALHYSEKGRDTWSAPNRLELALQQRSYAIANLEALEYELKKVR
ncbi:MAG: DUF4365 domain-containing protein [Rubinisphaera brasiliensis]|uniref:DUF4365 domain-containing protein n=1 Tax=Rubinisphaera brasiliensis TaxID=119 RepID=UPI00391AC809